ncbi:MAG: hypothetical protein ABJ004_09010 [Cyclobacteriaceae bacterium]
MKYKAKSIILIVFLLLNISSCKESSKYKDHQILDEFLLMNLKSWRQVKNSRYDRIPRYQVNDTIALKNDIRLMIIRNDTMTRLRDDPMNFMTFKKSTKIRLTKLNQEQFYNHAISFETIDSNSIIKGMTTTDELKFCQEGVNSILFEKNSYLEIVHDTRKNFDDELLELASKYGITKDSLINILAIQYYELTGNPILSF